MRSVPLLIGMLVTVTACALGGATLAPTQPPAPTEAQAAPTSAPPAVANTPTAPPAPSLDPTSTPVATATTTAELTPTATTAAAPRPTPASTGPLDFQTYVAGCRSAPTQEKPGNVIVTISVEATGGNGFYRYFHRGVEEPDKFIDIAWERGTRLNGRITVTSGDGQTLEKEYDVDMKSLDCP